MVSAFTGTCRVSHAELQTTSFEHQRLTAWLKRAVRLAVSEHDSGLCLVPCAFWVCCAHLRGACETTKVVSLSRALDFPSLCTFVECMEVLMPLASFFQGLCHLCDCQAGERNSCGISPSCCRDLYHVVLTKKASESMEITAGRKFKYQNNAITWGTTVTQ